MRFSLDPVNPVNPVKKCFVGQDQMTWILLDRSATLLPHVNWGDNVKTSLITDTKMLTFKKMGKGQ
jgi:hypothetical protein